MISIVLVDHPGSGAPDFKTLQTYAAEIDGGLKGEYADAYNRAATFRYGDLQDVDPKDHILGLFKDLDQPGDLGYHEPDGMGKVCPTLDAQDGVELSTTIDHEAKELTENLFCDLVRMGSDAHFWANESADAVEMGKYQRNGVWLSNFVLPSWYSGSGTKYDYLGVLKAPLTVDVGGYAQFFDDTNGWQQITHAVVAPRSYRRIVSGRSARYAARPGWRR